MPSLIVALSGPICSGKSTLATALAKRLGFAHVSTREFLCHRNPHLLRERTALQGVADELDRETGGKWLCDDLSVAIRHLPDTSLIVVDCIRSQCQVQRLQDSYGKAVLHVHLRGHDAMLAQRYLVRGSAKIAECESYSQALQNETERNVPNLASAADRYIETDNLSPEEVFAQTVSSINEHLSLAGAPML
jgi:adenylosuccinate synthase